MINPEELIYEKFTEAGLKTSYKTDDVLGTNFSTYTMLDLDPNYRGTEDVKTEKENAVFSFNCYGIKKGLAYAEARAVSKLLENLSKVSTDVLSSVVYGIQVLPVMDGLYGYTLMAEVHYLNPN
jgi:hypothetical protein